MTYQQALDYIHSFQKFGWILGRLERISLLLEKLGNPQEQLRFIHIAGTNGKGSTTAMCAKVLTVAGYTCGMYTSPYVIDFRERFQVNGEMITEQEFVDLVCIVKPVIEEMYREEVMITEFEVITVIGFLYFARHRCDFVCLETGLGGGDDATNVIKHPIVCAIASISLDHVAILGDTVEKIAGHKAGIIKPHSTVVCYPGQHPDAVGVLMEQCAKTGSTLIQPNPNHIAFLEQGVLHSCFQYQEEEYRLSLVGEHQVYNAVTVIEIIKALRTKGFPVPEQALKKGLFETTFPARFQLVREQPNVVLDGAHNLESAEALCRTLAKIQTQKIIIIGMLADKDYESVLKLLCQDAKHMICVPVNNPRTLAPKTLCKTAQKFCTASIETDYQKAYETALSLAQEEDFVIICGSLFLMGDMLKVINNV